VAPRRIGLDLWPPTLIRAAELGLRGRRTYELIGAVPPAPRLAIVGSRAAHRHTLAALGPIVAAAGARGWSLVSGGAIGIDGGAHRAALAHEVAQLAVLPCARDRPYPPGHLGLFAELAAEPRAGLLFAQPPGTEPTRAMFASRNAIVVGLADAVLVAEASLRSGSYGTGRLALRGEVPLAAIAGSPGCGGLIGAGARALPALAHASPEPESGEAIAALVAALERWLDRVLGREPAPEPAFTEPGWPPHLRWLATAITDAGASGLALDTLPDADAAALALVEAELLGLVCEGAAGRWLRVV
jgi:hypothetical protein